MCFLPLLLASSPKRRRKVISKLQAPSMGDMGSQDTEVTEATEVTEVTEVTDMEAYTEDMEVTGVFMVYISLQF